MSHSNPFVFMPTNSVSVFRSFPSSNRNKSACLVEVDLTLFYRYIDYSGGRINEVSVNAWIFSLLRESITDLLDLSGLKFRLNFSDIKNEFGNVLSLYDCGDKEGQSVQSLSKDISVAKGSLKRERMKIMHLFENKTSDSVQMPLPDRRLFAFRYMKLIYNALRISRKQTINAIKRPLSGKCFLRKPEFVVDISIANKMEKRFIKNGVLVKRTVYPVAIVMEKRLLWGITEKHFCRLLESYMEHNIVFFPDAV